MCSKTANDGRVNDPIAGPQIAEVGCNCVLSGSEQSCQSFQLFIVAQAWRVVDLLPSI